MKAEFPARFTVLIDQAAQSQGLTRTDEYISQWKWADEEERKGMAANLAEAVKKETESRFKSSK